MTRAFTGGVFGIAEVREVLERVTPRHAKRLMVNTLRGVTVTIKDKAKSKAPKDSGTLKKGMKVHKPRTPPAFPQFQVKFDKDAYYWRFVEYGTGGGRGSHIPYLTGEKEGANFSGARPFLAPAVHEVRANMPAIVQEKFNKKLQAAIKRELKKQRRSV